MVFHILQIVEGNITDTSPLRHKMMGIYVPYIFFYNYVAAKWPAIITFSLCIILPILGGFGVSRCVAALSCQCPYPSTPIDFVHRNVIVGNWKSQRSPYIQDNFAIVLKCLNNVTRSSIQLFFFTQWSMTFFSIRTQFQNSSPIPLRIRVFIPTSK